MTREKRLGRGLEALLGGVEADLTGEAAKGVDAARGDGRLATRIPLNSIDRNPFQPRRDFDDAEIASLAESLQVHGLLQPILVRPHEGRYQLVSGERRLRSAIRLGWSEIPAQVQEVDDRRMCEIAMVENLQRRDLNPLEKASSFQAYLQRYRCTQEELAGRLSIDRSTIANLIRLLELPDAVQQAVRDGVITQGHARALLPLGDEHEQVNACRRIQDEGWSVRATERWVRERLASEEPLAGAHPPGIGAKSARNHSESAQIAHLQQKLRGALGALVDIRQGARGAGRIVIHFRSPQDFERLFELLARDPSQVLRSAG